MDGSGRSRGATSRIVVSLFVLGLLVGVSGSILADSASQEEEGRLPDRNRDTPAPDTSVPWDTALPADTSVPQGTAPPSEAQPEVTSEATVSYVATPRTEGDIEFRAAPDDDADVTNVLPNPRQIDADTPVPVPLHLLLASPDPDAEWVEVLLPVRPNGTTGWIHSDEVDIATHSYRIEALIDEFALIIYEHGEVLFETEVGVGRSCALSPTDLYYTTELLRPTDPDGLYGSYAYGMSGFVEEFDTLSGDQGQAGFHGTNEPELIGELVTAGCIHLPNEDIEYIVDHLQLPLGVPVDIVGG